MKLITRRTSLIDLSIQPPQDFHRDPSRRVTGITTSSVCIATLPLKVRLKIEAYPATCITDVPAISIFPRFSPVLDIEQLSTQIVSFTQRHVSATALVCMLRGNSQSALIAGSDGHYYVVKFHGYPGGRGLMNEVIGYELARMVGLPCPEWVPIRISGSFLDEHPEIRYKSETTVIRPLPGIHFGSRYLIPQAHQRNYEFLPSSWTDRVVNRDDFVGMLLMDLWVNNCGRRQAIFLEDTCSRQIRAIFVDHDEILGGKFVSEETTAERIILPNLRFYRNLWEPTATARWKAKLRQVDDSWIDSALDAVPVEWTQGRILAWARHQLRRRRRMLTSFFHQADDLLGADNMRVPRPQFL